MNIVYLLLGSNLENREAMLRKAAQGINAGIGTIVQSSSVYESEPWGFSARGNFLNQVVKVETTLNASDLLEAILEIERGMGRMRGGGAGAYTSRTIDIDILFYNDEIIHAENLKIPHPLIPERMFTLKPMCELDGALIHPVFKKSLQVLMAECPDRNEVVLFSS